MFTWGDALKNNIDRQTQFIRQATELQKRVAAQNAKAYYTRLGADKKNELKKKNIRYLAVPTVRTQETSPEAKEVVMVWSIDQMRLVGQNVCELKKKPRVGEVGTYDKKKAEYIGKGPETTVMSPTNEGPSMSTPAFANRSRTGMLVPPGLQHAVLGEFRASFGEHAFRYRNAVQKSKVYPCLILTMTAPRRFYALFHLCPPYPDVN